MSDNYLDAAGCAMRLRELLAADTAVDIVGRGAELARLHALLDSAGPRIAHVYGVPGIGKSTLVRRFAAEARECGAQAVVVDCREIEPTPEGFLMALATMLEACPGKRVEDIAARLGDSRHLLVIALDTFEVLSLLDAWLRLTFIPALPGNVRIVMAGRHSPALAWRTGGWERIAVNLCVGPLSADQSRTLLAASGLDSAQYGDLAASLHGHPLALRLSGAATRLSGAA